MNQERLFKVLLGPHITEKAAMTAGAATQVVFKVCLLYTSPSPRDGLLSRMPSSA